MRTVGLYESSTSTPSYQFGFSVCPTLCFGRVGVLTSLPSDDQQIVSALRARASPFHHIQLLTTLAVVALGSRQECFRRESGPGARWLWLLSGRLRRHARTHPPVDQRAPARHTFHHTGGGNTKTSGPSKTAGDRAPEISNYKLPHTPVFVFT